MSGGRERNRHTGRYAAFRNLPTPTDRQRLQALVQEQLPITPTETRTAELSRATVALLLEVRVFGPLGAEVGERRLEVPEALLKRHAGQLVEELQFSLLLPAGEHGPGLEVGDAVALRRPVRTASFQRLAADQAQAAQRPTQQGLLRGRRVEPAAESSLPLNTSKFWQNSVKGCSAASSRLAPVAIPPRPEVRDCSREFR